MTTKGSRTTLVHSVYFTLKDKSDEARDQFIGLCDKYLSDHPGVEYYFAGRRTADLDRAVNDGRFDVALLVVFKDRSAHDTYQTSDLHREFIEKTSPGWEEVRVFDAGGGE
ncbi:unnamed protein product [marine sediment metagenome]|uniref:Stress-response A/B barrel domain-containing protein n=1 Tax=marine sediment metagenome TaxID=412755 RepID=X0XSR9_9ZZZZ